MELRAPDARDPRSPRRREHDAPAVARDIFSERFLIKRPLLQALEPDRAGPPVLLIDELDRADEPFEAFLLEMLADFQVTIPELGTVARRAPPIVVITSNRTREIHDALKRRCLYHWIDYPTPSASSRSCAASAPEAPATRWRAQIVALRAEAARGRPLQAAGRRRDDRLGARARRARRVALDPETVNDTLGVLLKYQDDIARVQGSEAARILSEVRAELAAV